MPPFNMGESGKLMKNLTSSIDVFNGQQSRFEDWSDKTKICFQSWYPLISEIIDGKERPPEVIGYRSLTDQRDTQGTTAETESRETARVNTTQRVTRASSRSRATDAEERQASGRA